MRSTSSLAIAMILSLVIVILANNVESFCFQEFVHLPTKTTTATSTTIFLAEETEQKIEGLVSDSDEIIYKVRDCQYRELSSVATLVVESFYDKKKVNLMARKLYQLAEMNRLQQNFPYPESRGVHRMLVMEAIGGNQGGKKENVDDPTIVGFCDVDCRPCATKTKLPRPYLSDLAIDPQHRRRGLARRLIEASEEFVQSGTDADADNPKKPPFEELWIRVASDNDAALGLYKDKLGYSSADWSTGEEENSDDQPEIYTLRKDFRT